MNTCPTRRIGLVTVLGALALSGCSAPIDEGDQSASALAEETILEAKLYDTEHPMPPRPDCDVYTAATIRSAADGTFALHLRTRRDGTCAVDLPNDERTYAVKRSQAQPGASCQLVSYKASVDGAYSVSLRDGRVGRTCGATPPNTIVLQESRDGAFKIRYSDPTLDVDPNAATYKLATPLDAPIAHVYEGSAEGVKFHPELRLPTTARASQRVTRSKAELSALPVLLVVKVTSPAGATEIDVSYRRDLVLGEHNGARPTEAVEHLRQSEWLYSRGDHGVSMTVRNVEVVPPSLDGTYATENPLLPVPASEDLAVKEGVLTLGSVPDTLDVLAVIDLDGSRYDQPATTVTLKKVSP